MLHLCWCMMHSHQAEYLAVVHIYPHLTLALVNIFALKFWGPSQLHLITKIKIKLAALEFWNIQLALFCRRRARGIFLAVFCQRVHTGDSQVCGIYDTELFAVQIEGSFDTNNVLRTRSRWLVNLRYTVNNYSVSNHISLSIYNTYSLHRTKLYIISRILEN